MADRSVPSFYDALDCITRMYNLRGFEIRKMHCNQKFRSVMDLVCDEMDLKMNYAPSGDHVPEAERNNRVLQERIRIQYHRLPFTKLPREMWRGLVCSVTDQLNFFPTDHGFPNTTVPGN